MLVSHNLCASNGVKKHSMYEEGVSRGTWCEYVGMLERDCFVIIRTVDYLYLLPRSCASSGNHSRCLFSQRRSNDGLVFSACTGVPSTPGPNLGLLERVACVSKNARPLIGKGTCGPCTLGGGADGLMGWWADGRPGCGWRRLWLHDGSKARLAVVRQTWPSRGR